MKEYCNQNVFKEKAALARREREFKNGTTGTTYSEFLATFTPKIDALHIKTRKIKTKSAKDLRKIYAGGQDFSPKAQSFRDVVDFWKRIVKRKKGVLTGRTSLRALAERVDIPLQFPKTLTIAQAGAKLSLAY